MRTTQAGASPRLAVVLLCVTAAAILISSLAQRYLGHVMSDPDLDFHDYYFAATVVRENPHADLYRGATIGNPQLRSAPADSPIALVARDNGVTDTELYLYPPLFADLLTPVTHVSMASASHAWRAFNLLAVVVSALCLARLAGLALASPECLMLVLLACMSWPVHEAVSLGQITPLLLLLWTLGVATYAWELPLLSAFLFALATAFKVTPLLLVPLFLIWRNWRWLAGYVASLLVAVLTMLAWNGPANLLSYTRVVAAMGGSLPSLQNKCIGSIIAWVYYGRVFSLSTVHSVMTSTPPNLSLAIKGADLLFYTACLLLVWRRGSAHSRDARVILIAIFALITLVMAPVSWRHGYTVALIPLALLWIQALHARLQASSVWLLALSSISVGSLLFDLAATAPLPAVVQILCAGVWPLSCALLCLDVLLRWLNTAAAAGKQ